MGAVYRARDVELDRWVAVKCLLDVERAGSRELAVKEARTLASLSHPNIMRVYDILSVGDQVWIVSEWLEGRCLAQLPMPLPPACVLAIMAQVYDALAAAHAAQVIHRDIKPSNVMIGNDGRVTLIDFGVAFAPGSSAGETIAGSLRYTDPRILEGDTPDASSDLFSAALMQVELMTGETVLPDLAPLPLYRHIKKNLEGRLEMLLDGTYPPLSALARRLTGRMRLDLTQESLEHAAAREAALNTQDLLRKLTLKAPEQYLATHLYEDDLGDAIADRIISQEIESALQSTILTPRQKAAWIAFKAASEGEDTTQALKTPTSRRAEDGGRTTYIIDVRRRRGTALTVTLATVVIASLVFWMKLASVPSTDELVSKSPVAEPTGPSRNLGLGSIVEPTSSNVMPPLADPATQVKPAGDPATTEQTATSTVPVHIVANAWATVILDGRSVGELPQAAPFRLTPGKHTLTLTSPSIEPLTTEIVVKAGEPARLRYHLTPKVVTHKIRLTEPGRLYVDGKDHGVVSTKNIPLSYGTHEILVKRNGKTSAPKTIALGPDSPSELVID